MPKLLPILLAISIGCIGHAHADKSNGSVQVPEKSPNYDLIAVKATFGLAGPVKVEGMVIADSSISLNRPVKVGEKVIFHTGYTADSTSTDTIPGTYKVRLYVNGELVSYDNSPGKLSPRGSSWYWTEPPDYHFKPEKPGVYKFRFIVDEENTIAETNENNNVIEGKIIVEEASVP